MLMSCWSARSHALQMLRLKLGFGLSFAGTSEASEESPERAMLQSEMWRGSVTREQTALSAICAVVNKLWSWPTRKQKARRA